MASKYIVMKINADTPYSLGPTMDVCGDILFIGPTRSDDEEVLLSRMVKIKEKVKEVYAKLKMLHSKKNVNFYYDMLEAILRS